MHCDVVIVGAGATGCWSAGVLSKTGLSVILLDAGRELEPRHLNGQSLLARAKRIFRVRIAKSQVIQARHGSYWSCNPDLFVIDSDHPYENPDDAFSWIRSRQIGGRTLIWGGVCLRLSDHEFKASELDGVGTAWPLSHNDLSEYYATVEKRIGVAGAQDGLHQLPDGVFRAPMSMTSAEKRFKAAVETKWSDRVVVMARGVWCDAKPDKWPKGSAQDGPLREVSRVENVTIRPHSVVEKLVFYRKGTRARGVVVQDTQTGKNLQIDASVVILAAGTFETIRILLNSRGSDCPSFDADARIGRGIMNHIGVSTEFEAPGSSDLCSNIPFGGPNSIIIPRFVNLSGQHEKFLRGYGIWGGIQRHGVHREQAHLKLRPGFHRGFLLAQGEMISRTENRVVLGSTKDHYGIRVPRIECTLSQNEELMIDHMKKTLQEMVDTAGGRVLGKMRLWPLGTMAHEVGGVPMGEEPKTSVLDPYNRCWTTRNVVVVDGSCWASAGWQNPTLTMLALAERASQKIIELFNHREL